MNIEKAQWSTDGDNFQIGMSLSKVDKENRTVTGWASLDNPDLQGDVVLAEASEKAFSRFRGNIREMHQPIAVGRMLSYKPDSYYDPVSKSFYSGILVTVYVSKGAQDTWEKVCDGTLQAFSIKGPIKDSKTEFSKAAGKPLRYILDYELEELSLVDSGGNQHCNIVNIEKMNGQSVVKGTMTELSSTNVFYCGSHEDGGIAKTSTEESVTCPEGHKMDNIGWFEYENDNELAEKIQGIVDSHVSAHVSKQEIPATNEGGVDVADETPEPGTSVPAVVPVAEEGKAENEVTSSVENSGEGASNEEVAPAEVPAEEATVEKAADVSEVVVEEPDFTKMFGDLQNAITAGLQKNQEIATAAVEKVNDAITSLVEKHNDLTSKFDSLRSELDNVEKRVDGVESETAVKKSGDLGGSTEETVSKSNGQSKWGGRFLGISALES